MDVLTEHEIEGILQRLEALATELEHDASVRTFYTFVLTAQAFADTKHALAALPAQGLARSPGASRVCAPRRHRERFTRNIPVPLSTPLLPPAAPLPALPARARSRKRYAVTAAVGGPVNAAHAALAAGVRRGTRRVAPAATQAARHHPERQGRTPDTPTDPQEGTCDGRQ